MHPVCWSLITYTQMAEDFDFSVTINKGAATARLTPLNPQAAHMLWEELFVGKHSYREDDSVDLPYKDIKTITREFLADFKITWPQTMKHATPPRLAREKVLDLLRKVIISEDKTQTSEKKDMEMTTISIPSDPHLDIPSY